MADLISRQAAIDALATYIYNVYKSMTGKKMPADKCRQAAESVIGELPPVQPNQNADPGKMVVDCISRQPKNGKWKTAYLDHEAMGERPLIYYCSVCCQCIAYPTNFCPNCGANMMKII